MTEHRMTSINLLNKLFYYNPKSGILTWKPRDDNMFKSGRRGRSAQAKAWNTSNAGNQAGCVRSDGYVTVGVLGTPFMAHRVAWAISFGRWPGEFIDHINGDKSDNRLVNLREVTNAENIQNCKKSINNVSGITGVYWASTHKKWHARICHNKRRFFLGAFDSIEAATSARKAAELEFGFHPNHGRG